MQKLRRKKKITCNLQREDGSARWPFLTKFSSIKIKELNVRYISAFVFSNNVAKLQRKIVKKSGRICKCTFKYKGDVTLLKLIWTIQLTSVTSEASVVSELTSNLSVTVLWKQLFKSKNSTFCIARSFKILTVKYLLYIYIQN